jgi:hypothetical protein
MKLHFEPNLDYQLAAIESVCDLFRGQEIRQTEFTVTQGFGGGQIALAGLGPARHCVNLTGSSRGLIARIRQHLQVVDRRFEPRCVTGYSVLEPLQAVELHARPRKIAFFESILDSFDRFRAERSS